MAKLNNSVLLLAQLKQRKTFFQLRRRGFISRGKVLQNLIVALRRLLIVSLAKLNFAEIEIAVSGEIGVGIVLDIVGKFLRGEVVLVAIVVAQRVVVEHIRRRSRSRGLLLRLRCGLLRRQALLRRLHVLELLAYFSEARLQFIERVIERLDLAGELVNMRRRVSLLLLQRVLLRR